MSRHPARHLLAATLLLAPLSLSISASAHAADCLPKAGQGWIRLPPMAMPMMAGFVRIENPCAQAAVIVSAESLSFGEVTVHETREVDGVNKMREVEQLRIEPGKAVELKPGGMHLMLYRPYEALKEGDEAVIALKLQDGRSIPVTFTVRKPKP
ncbi:copper chaperone PCu(A)C [Pseudoxanthomonas sp. UTMC 1351]|uniref:copper chaperone PCu(A)C n=1 Tax=Pseudoxanthomonas sp. UTMC 1351 TaxID=2695853 RepID=UPI0034CDD498